MTHKKPSIRMKLFLEEFAATGGNGTEAAMRVFNTKSRLNAATIAQQYLKRALARGQISEADIYEIVKNKVGVDAVIRDEVVKKQKLKDENPCVYIIRDFSYAYKIGKSCNFHSRFQQLQSANSAPLEVIHIIETPNMTETEKMLHKKFQTKRLRGEWFTLDHEDIVWIKKSQKNFPVNKRTVPVLDFEPILLNPIV